MHKLEINFTPRLLAEAFWEMDSQEQAEFFAELNNVIQTDPSLEYPESASDCQWYAMSQEINKIPEAKKMACQMTVNIFNQATSYLSRQHIDY